MNQYAWVSLVAVLGWLVLAIGALRSHRIGARKAVTLGLVWAAIFALAAAVFASAGG